MTADEFDDSIPAFSADGRRVLFLADRAGVQSLWSVPAAGGVPVPIVTPPLSEYPVARPRPTPLELPPTRPAASQRPGRPAERTRLSALVHVRRGQRRAWATGRAGTTTGVRPRDECKPAGQTLERQPPHEPRDRDLALQQLARPLALAPDPLPALRAAPPGRLRGRTGPKERLLHRRPLRRRPGPDRGSGPGTALPWVLQPLRAERTRRRRRHVGRLLRSLPLPA